MISPNDRYHLSVRILHWLMAAGFIFMWGCGYAMTELVAEDSEWEELLFGWHISCGVTLLFLLAVRLGFRLMFAVPPLPDAIPKIERVGAAAGHIGLYVLPLLIIFFGWAETDVSGHSVEWFGVAMPKIFPTTEIWLGLNIGGLLEDLHAWSAYAMLALVAVHIAGVIKHRRDGHDILPRMTLGGTSRK